MDPRERMEELYKLLAYHNERYYNHDEPEPSIPNGCIRTASPSA